MDITRKQTSDDAGDFIDIRNFTPTDVFRKMLAEIEAEYTKNFKPFDSQCARIDFKEMLEAAERESERKHGFISNSDMKSIKMIDFSKYGEEDRFDIGRKDEEVEQVIVNGMKTSVKIGVTVRYVCKKRGHGISVFYPIELWEKRNNKKGKKEKDE